MLRISHVQYEGRLFSQTSYKILYLEVSALALTKADQMRVRAFILH